MQRFLSSPIRFCLFVLCVASVALSTGCVKDKNKASKKEMANLSQYVIDKAPDDITPLNIDYDGKITLLGYKGIPSGKVKPGTRISLTMYWQVKQEIGKSGWNLFTHILDGAGKRLLNLDNVGPIRKWHKDQQALPPSEWKKGKVYVDEQKFTLPKKIKTDTVDIVTGIWKDKDRLAIKSGPQISDDRGLVKKLEVDMTGVAKRHSTRVPKLRADKLDTGVKIKIDGKLDEEAWKKAPKAGPFVNVATGAPDAKFPVQGDVKLLWNDDNLYLGFDVKDPDLTGGFKKDAKDPHLWTKDTVEVMVDPDGDGDNRDYYEIQVSPQNLVFDSQFDQYNKPKGGPDGPFGHQEWSANLESAVTLNGTLDKPGDKDQGYVVEIRIPWKSFSKAKKVPPEVGQTWRMNFYAMKNNNGVAWSPILKQGNFHKASRFGRVLFADKDYVEPSKAAKAKNDKGEDGEKAKARAEGAGEGIKTRSGAMEKAKVIPPSPTGPAAVKAAKEKAKQAK